MFVAIYARLSIELQNFSVGTILYFVLNSLTTLSFHTLWNHYYHLIPYQTMTVFFVATWSSDSCMLPSRAVPMPMSSASSFSQNTARESALSLSLYYYGAKQK